MVNFEGERISVLLVEDVAEMAALIGHLLEGIPEVGRWAVARNLAEARLELDRRRPDLVLLDLVLGLESGQDLLPYLQVRGVPAVRLLAAADGGELEGAAGVAQAGAPQDGGPSMALELGGAASPWAGVLLKPSWEGLDAYRERFRKALLRVVSDRFRR